MFVVIRPSHRKARRLRVSNARTAHSSSRHLAALFHLHRGNDFLPEKTGSTGDVVYTAPSQRIHHPQLRLSYLPYLPCISYLSTMDSVVYLRNDLFVNTPSGRAGLLSQGSLGTPVSTPGSLVNSPAGGSLIGSGRSASKSSRVRNCSTPSNPFFPHDLLIGRPHNLNIPFWTCGRSSQTGSYPEEWT